MERISIIVPVYNVENYLARCLDSVLAQSYSDWECILVNDGSTDASLRIARKYEARDRRFMVISQENQGLSAARNTGILKSSASFITLLDSDDMWHPDFLKVMYQGISSGQCDICVCNYQKFETGIPDHVSADGWSCSTEACSPQEAVKSVLVDRKRFMIVAWGKLYRRELFQDISYPAGMFHEDEFVTYRLFAASRKVAVVDLPLYYYFQRTGSIMAQYRKERLCVLNAFRESCDFIRENIPELYREVYVNYLMNLAIAYYRIHNRKDCRDIRKQIRQEFIRSYRNYHGKMTDIAVKRIALLVFRLAPWAYCLAAGTYLRMNEDE